MFPSPICRACRCGSISPARTATWRSRRIEDLAREAGVRVELRPFLLGPIFQAQGWNDTPFRLFPGKGAYMMRDIARLADKYGVIYRRPRLFRA